MTFRNTTHILAALLVGASLASAALAQDRVGESPWGAEDELGRLNLITPASRAEIMARVSADRVYDLSVDYFVGMPSWQAAGDPHYQIWMTHTPHGTEIDDPMGVGREMNAHVGYTGSAISMYTHSGTHIDAFNHFGIGGRIYNGFRAEEHLGDRGWKKTGAETIPPIVARGVLVDVAASKGLDMLPDGYRITRADIEAALARQGTELRKGDVVLIRTGRMRVYEEAQRYMANPPGLGLEAAKFLVEEGGAMILGADNLSFEAFPSEIETNYVPLHTYLLAQMGVPIMELVFLEDLARDGVFEFAFVGGSLKLRGADAAPMRPIAFPLTRGR
ncbi:MAG: cyclase family protein [Hyphomonas sp.]|nr:cyclase family protein [Hyphomonas sp.]